MDGGGRGTAKRTIVTGLAALAAAASLLVVFVTTGEPPARGGADTARPASPGWRWEWYGTIEVQVPADWGYGTTGTPPCLTGDEPSRPYVGRPGPVPAIACLDPLAPQDERGDYLWFDTRAAAGVRSHGGGWVEQTRVVDGVALTVLSDDAALRARVLGSARPATGRTGCPADHAVTTDPRARPDAASGGLAALGRVESVAVCRYAIGKRALPSAGRGLSGNRLTGADARAIVRAIRAAPEGTGPNEPGNCVREVAYGDEVLLLVVRDGARAQEVVVRYSGCDGHGVDDGHSRHRLTADVLRPLLSGPNAPDTLAGAVAALVWP